MVEDPTAHGCKESYILRHQQLPTPQLKSNLYEYEQILVSNCTFYRIPGVPIGGHVQISDRVMCRQVQQECLSLTRQPCGPAASVKMWSGRGRIKPSRVT
jgi:hypothetical protein